MPQDGGSTFTVLGESVSTDSGSYTCCREWPQQRLGGPEPLTPICLDPSQAEGGQTPLDAFQLPARVAREDVSSPEPEPPGERHLPLAPGKLQGCPWPCAVQAKATCICGYLH